MELQKVLSALEASSGQGRNMLRLQTQNAETIRAEHLSAARESWVQATQVLILPPLWDTVCTVLHLNFL